jgi:hypothetical protein
MAKKTFSAGAVLVLSLVTGRMIFADQLTLRLFAAETHLLVGQPVVLTLTYAGTSEVALDRYEIGEPSPEGPLRIMIERGGSFVPYRRSTRESVGLRSKAAAVRIGPTREEAIDLVIAWDASTAGVAFPSPGTYRVLAEFRHQGAIVRSNTVVLTVSAPVGSEREVFDFIDRPKWWEGLAYSERIPPEIASIAARYPTSVYLQGPRLNDLRQRVVDIANAPRASQAELQRELLPYAREVASARGQFGSEALLILADLQRFAGSEADARDTLETLVREYPNRRATRLARLRLASLDPS